MTTICTDGVTLAADSRTSASHEIVSDNTVKLRRLPDGSVVGNAGTCTGAARALEEMASAMIENRPARLMNGEYTLLQLTPEGCAIVYWGELTPIAIPTPAAIGTGGEFARGAMFAGASPAEAITIAKKLDRCSGGRVRTMKPRN